MSISTHVLDTARGVPAAGVPIRLEKDGTVLGAGRTDTDGRLRWDQETTHGRYRLVFDILAYHGPDAFYPEVAVSFTVVDGRHHHVPLLLSPFGYSTYRGS
ncbi:hydroxyisourate hydrolase [Dactylosporangium sp. AC04546]|uniref:hydroxyisourate hydrolase n=1 Tax=Dactylosporangium sp. AC04546 TaxID=2862460 RepID=UPI001EDD5E6F|nr:hydroxyisourate hydrolase [Dactylosporangium sp. AC04546]WVK85944.1 hydroxyisourate hydrolase [Dactylosporangium sp. AC04546]